MPLAAVLWNSGSSFGGVVAFIFADLIVLPILDIYRKYYGPRMSLFLLGSFYLTMAAAGLTVDLVFEALGLVPAARTAKVVQASITPTTPASSISCSWSWPPCWWHDSYAPTGSRCCA